MQRKNPNCGGVGVGGVRVWDPILAQSRRFFSLLDEATPNPRAWICPLLNSPKTWEMEGFGGFHAGHDLSLLWCCSSIKGAGGKKILSALEGEAGLWYEKHS